MEKKGTETNQSICDFLRRSNIHVMSSQSFTNVACKVVMLFKQKPGFLETRVEIGLVYGS